MDVVSCASVVVLMFRVICCSERKYGGLVGKVQSAKMPDAYQTLSLFGLH